MQLFTTTTEIFRSSIVYISFIVIISIVVKNSDPKKLKVFLRIITYCCLANLIYAIYTIITGETTLGETYRVGGLDKAPVLFGYNMLLGFWLVLMNPIIQPDLNKSNTKLDKYLAFAFFTGIILSKSMGAIFGLFMGMIAIFIFSKKIKISFLIKLFFLLIVILITYNLFPLIYTDVFGLERYVGKIQNITYDKSGRFFLWSDMLKAYLDQISFLKFLFGGGQGYGTTLINRGTHSDHLKFLFDHGVIGFFIYHFKVLSSLKLVKEFNIFLIGFIVSVLASGIFYVNFGSITNSFTCILVLIVLSNYNKLLRNKS